MRRTLAPLGALLLAAALAVVLPSPAATAGRGQSTSSVAKPSVKTVTRTYGAGPVRPDHGDQVLEIRFKGKKGDRVMVTRPAPGDDVDVWNGDAELTGQRGAVNRERRPWWRLPRGGWYTFRLEMTYGKQVAAQLTKLRFVDIERDAPERRLPAKRGYVWAAGFEVPKSGLLSGTVLSSGDHLLVRPDKPALLWAGRYTLLLGDDMPATLGSPYGYPRSRAQHAGAVMRLLTTGGVASAVTPTRVAGVLDGAPVPVDTSAAHAVEIVLDGTAGQWFSTSEGSVSGYVTILQGPDGKYVDPTPRRDLWQLTQTGQSRLLLFPVQGEESAPLQLSSVAVGPALVPGAAPTTVTADPAGRGTILPVSATLPGYNTLKASNAGFSNASWYAVLMVAHVGAYPHGCNGCGDYDYVGVDAGHPVSNPGAGRAVYLPPTNGTGSVDLQLLGQP